MIGIIIKNTQETRHSVMKHMMSEKSMSSGALTTALIAIWKAFWTFVTSVVKRVTIEAVENLSMFLKL